MVLNGPGDRFPRRSPTLPLIRTTIGMPASSAVLCAWNTMFWSSVLPFVDTIVPFRRKMSLTLTA